MVQVPDTANKPVAIIEFDPAPFVVGGDLMTVNYIRVTVSLHGLS